MHCVCEWNDEFLNWCIENYISILLNLSNHAFIHIYIYTFIHSTRSQSQCKLRGIFWFCLNLQMYSIDVHCACIDNNYIYIHSQCIYRMCSFDGISSKFWISMGNLHSILPIQRVVRNKMIFLSKCLLLMLLFLSVCAYWLMCIMLAIKLNSIASISVYVLPFQIKCNAVYNCGCLTLADEWS